MSSIKERIVRRQRRGMVTSVSSKIRCLEPSLSFLTSKLWYLGQVNLFINMVIIILPTSEFRTLLVEIWKWIKSIWYNV